MNVTVRLFFFLLLFNSFSLVAQSEQRYLKLAEQASQSNNYREAIGYISKAIALDTLNAAYYQMRGVLIAGLKEANLQLYHVDRRNFKLALRDFNKALELEPFNAELYFNRGKLYLNFRHYQEALNDFEQQQKFAGSKFLKLSAMDGKAKAKFGLKEIDAAFRIFEDALKYDTANVIILNNLALQYLSLEDFEVARKLLNKALKNNEDNLITLSNIGYLAIKSERFEPALKIYNDLIKSNPEIGILYNNRGFIKYQFGLLEEALEDINFSIQLASANAYAYKNRALVFLAKNQKDKACKDLFMAKSLGYTLDHDNEVLWLLAEHCLEVNRKISPRD